MNPSEEEYCALLSLAEDAEEAAIPKKDRRILVQQHFEMRPVLVEFNTTFQNLMNYFNHPDMHVIIYHQYQYINCTRSDVIHTLNPYTRQLKIIQIEPRNSDKFDL